MHRFISIGAALAALLALAACGGNGNHSDNGPTTTHQITAVHVMGTLDEPARTSLDGPNTASTSADLGTAADHELGALDVEALNAGETVSVDISTEDQAGNQDAGTIIDITLD